MRYVVTWLCGFKNEDASPIFVVAFASPGEQFFPSSRSLLSLSSFSHVSAAFTRE
jgi:hypothetical protein